MTTHTSNPCGDFDISISSVPRPTSAIVATRLDTPVVAGPMGGTANASEHGYTLYENGELWRDLGKHSYRVNFRTTFKTMEAEIKNHKKITACGGRWD